MKIFGFIKRFFDYRGFIFMFLYPVCLSPLLILYDQNEAKGAFALLLMAGYWITEAMPIYVTSLLPIVMAPLMGLLDSNTITTEYFRDSNVLFMGGAFLAVATEHHNLHRRIGVIVLQVMGANLRMLMLGLMLPTWFLSMWMSNAAATIMMLTIVEAIVSRLEAVKTDAMPLKQHPWNRELRVCGDTISREPDDKDMNMSETILEEVVEDGDATSHVVRAPEQEVHLFAVGLCLAISFSSTIGGMATVIGTPTNVVFYGMVTDRYGTDTSLSFGTWAAFAIPISLLLLFFTWVILGVLFIGPKKFFCSTPNKARNAAIKGIVEDEKKAIGSITFSEGMCMFLLLFTIFLWISRKPGTVGWSQLVPENTLPNGKKQPFVTDTQAAILGTIAFLSLPAHLPCSKEKRDGIRINYQEVLLPWKVAESKIPWGVIILIGGGFALSKICSESGLSKLVGQNLVHLKSLPTFALVLVLTMIGATITTFVANAATATVLLPIMFQVAEAIHIHPFYLGLPVTIASSMSFILPASTSTNAIVYSTGRIKLNQMILSGFLVYLCGILITTFCTCIYTVLLFDLNEYPSWAPNNTASTVPVGNATTPHQLN